LQQTQQDDIPTKKQLRETLSHQSLYIYWPFVLHVCFPIRSVFAMTGIHTGGCRKILSVTFSNSKCFGNIYYERSNHLPIENYCAWALLCILRFVSAVLESSYYF